MQKRLVRKLNLERAISCIGPHPSPKAHLEQYTIPAEVAAEILYTATYTYNDIIDKTVIDLGCGTGRLAIAAALMDAKEVVGIDIDKTAIKEAVRNAEKLGVKTNIDWVVGDITAVRGRFDTVLQNPPFGVQKRKADRKFLEKALQIGTRIYSLQKATDTVRDEGNFLRTFIEKMGGKIKAVYVVKMSIPHMFKFHRKQKHQFTANLYVIEKAASKKNKRFIEQHERKVSNTP